MKLITDPSEALAAVIEAMEPPTPFCCLSCNGQCGCIDAGCACHLAWGKSEQAKLDARRRDLTASWAEREVAAQALAGMPGYTADPQVNPASCPECGAEPCQPHTPRCVDAMEQLALDGAEADRWSRANDGEE